MSRPLIASIQEVAEMRLILPFGLNLQLGDVVSVGEDGDLTLQGNCQSLLGVPPGVSRDAQPGLDIDQQYGDGTTCIFRAAGTPSKIQPGLPSVHAGFDVTFAASNGWTLALTGRKIYSLAGVDALRRPILDAYQRGVWESEWALISSIATVDKMTLLASSEANTQVALDLAGNVSGTSLANLTASASIMYANKQLLKCIVSASTTVLCEGIVVDDRWYRRYPRIGTLQQTVDEDDPAQAASEQFWHPLT